jgi:hypothetical protein
MMNYAIVQAYYYFNYSMSTCQVFNCCVGSHGSNTYFDINKYYKQQLIITLYGNATLLGSGHYLWRGGLVNGENKDLKLF